MPTKPKGKTSGRGAKSKPAAERAPRASEKELDTLSAKVVKMRDGQNKNWTDICDALDLTPSRARQLYNRGGGEPAPRAAAAKSKPAARKGGAKSGAASRRAKGKRNPS